MFFTGFNYLKSRHVTENEIKEFDISYCDNNLKTSSLKLVNYSVSSSKFKDSIIIPIYDLYDNLLGIYSRRLNSLNQSKIDGSSWQKTHHLFGLNKSWKYLIEKDSVIITEGPFDMIACWKHGFKNSVALMGTCLSFTQACLLSRFVRRAYLMLDNDNAGKVGVEKCIKILKDFEFECKVINLQNDPDEELEKNKNNIGELCE
jgi:DNA primase